MNQVRGGTAAPHFLVRPDHIRAGRLPVPQIIETTVYRLDELSSAARENARSWYREHALTDEWYDSVFDDFAAIAALLGLQLKTGAVRLLGGGSREEMQIYFTGFASQGDGACFEAWYRYVPDAAVRVREYAPLDVQLHGIADRLQHIQRRNFYELTAETSRQGRYYHEQAMRIDVDRESAVRQPPSREAEAIVAEALRDLARWLYRQLEREHDHLLSDEVVDESIAVNDYTFTEDGERFG